MCRRALKGVTHYLNTHLQAPVRRQFYRLLSSAVRFGWASYDSLTERSTLVMGVARTRYPSSGTYVTKVQIKDKILDARSDEKPSLQRA